MLTITRPHFPLLPAILSWRALGSAVVQLPILAQERKGRETACGFTPREQLLSAEHEQKGAADGPRSAGRRGRSISWPTSSIRAGLSWLWSKP